MEWFLKIVFQNLEGVHNCKGKKFWLIVKSEIFGPDCDTYTDKNILDFFIRLPHV
jgi:hypothetical protein